MPGRKPLQPVRQSRGGKFRRNLIPTLGEMRPALKMDRNDLWLLKRIEPLLWLRERSWSDENRRFQERARLPGEGCRHNAQLFSVYDGQINMGPRLQPYAVAANSFSGFL